MKRIIKGLVVAGTLAAPILVVGPAQAAEISASDGPTGLLTCTLNYLDHGNPYSPIPTAGVVWVQATNTFNYTLVEAGAVVGYAFCVAI